MLQSCAPNWQGSILWNGSLGDFVAAQTSESEYAYTNLDGVA